MALKQMLWEGRSLPTTSGTSVCTGLLSFQVIPAGYLRKGKKLIFTTVTAGITGALDMDGSAGTGVVNPV